MNPLCITSTTCDESELGRQNINNLRSLGVDRHNFHLIQKLEQNLIELV